MTDKVNTLFEPKHFNSNPETDDLLWDATELEDGMVVMIEEPSVRADISEVYMDSTVMEQAYRWNRWATVSDLIRDVDSDQVLFFATYSDGSKKKLVTSADYAWYVKKVSVESMVPPANPDQVMKDLLLEDSSDPEWVKRVEDVWQDEKGTSTKPSDVGLGVWKHNQI